MALVKCRECGKDVSSTAAACPHCGAPRKPAAKQYGCGTAIVVVVVGSIVIAQFLPSPAPRRAPDPVPASTPAVASAAPAAAPAANTTGSGTTATPAAQPEAPAKQTDSDARLEGCRAKLKAAQAIDLLTNMTFERGIPKVWVGPTWYTIPIDAKEGFAQTAACFFVAGDAGKAISFDIFDGMSGKKIGRWKFTRLEID
jgi:hypothetical protein